MSVTSTTTPGLSRTAGYGRPAAPVRLLHLGLGNFFRAHQAWYTEHAEDAAEWGYSAFTGRSAGAAEVLRPQQGLYTVLTRGPEDDTVDVVSSLSEVHPASDTAAWADTWRSAGLAVVTLTVTEAGYLQRPGGGLDHDRPEVRADVASLRAGSTGEVATAPGRLVAGLLARRAAEGGPLTLVPCDNLPGNGRALARVVRDLAEAVDPSLTTWVDQNVVVATSMVDRITPATTDEHRAAVLATLGVADAAPVPTEPFAEWVIAGGFPAGRPDWESAGAILVDDVEPYEQRKLRLLNGAHSLLAYAGLLRGHPTVDEAMGDPTVTGWVEQWWDEACRHLPFEAADLRAYREALTARFTNGRIRHALAQIAADGSQKLPIRVLPTLRAEIAAGRPGTASSRAVAAWVAAVRAGLATADADADLLFLLRSGTDGDAVGRALDRLAPDLAGHEDVRAAIADQVGRLARGVVPR